MKRLTPRVPPSTIRWYPKGENCTDATEGDMMLVNHGTFMDGAIGVGERVLSWTERELAPFIWCRHAALVVAGGPNGSVSEMGPLGHEYHALDKYEHELYAVVHFDVDPAARERVLANDEAMHSIEYGWITYASIAADGLTAAKFSLAWGSAMICSTHVTMAEMGCGLFPDRQPSAVIPAHLAKYVGAIPPAKGPAQ